MIGRVLKAYMPRSLYGRATLILLVPVLTILAVVSIVFIQRLYEDVTGQMTSGVADEIALVMREIDAGETKEIGLENARDIARALNIGIVFATEPLQDAREWIDLSGLNVRATLNNALPGIEAVDLIDDENGVRIQHESIHGPVILTIDRRRLSPRNPHQFLVLIGATAFFMTVIALLYLRGQLRPIRRLAAAASAFGKGRVVAYRPLGATEVREAGQAFLEMRDRIERQIEQRTLMLSGVSHDLRTPLTRMRLALSLAEETSETEAILHDVQEMEQMLDAFLSFARSEAFDEPEAQHVAKIVQEAAERAERAGRPIDATTAVDPDLVLKVRPVSLARALDNLIGNAKRYGSVCRLSVVATETHVRFMVEDDGPGIPAERREEAVQPFARLDEARNQDGGSGVGLGLAIAADIARQHGGAMELGDSDALGGLKIEISLPR